MGELSRYQEIKKAEVGAKVSIGVYVIIATIKIIVGIVSHSQALTADGFNNFTDTIASIAILVGLMISRKPADNEHRYGHWKAENVASFITSLIMFVVGIQVLIDAVKSISSGETVAPDPIATWVGLGSAIAFFVLYIFNRHLGKKYNSSTILAVAKDNLSDVLTSIGASVAVLSATLGLAWLDEVTAVIIGFVIIYTAFTIFRESVFFLSDGFDTDKLKGYKEIIVNFEGIEDVTLIRARTLGANVFMDITVLVNGNLTVNESHDMIDQLEQYLINEIGIYDVDIHVEPLMNSEEK